MVGESSSDNVSEVNLRCNDEFGENKDVVLEKLFESVNAEAVENALERNDSGKPPVGTKLIRDDLLYSSLPSPETNMDKLD